MQLTESERGMYQLLLRANAPVVERLTAAQKELEENTTTFRMAVASRLKDAGVPIPPEAIGVNAETGDIIDLRMQQATPLGDEPATEAEPDTEDEPTPLRGQRRKAASEG